MQLHNRSITKLVYTETSDFDLKIQYNAANLPISYYTGMRDKQYTYLLYYRLNGQKYFEWDTKNNIFADYEYDSLGRVEFENTSKGGNTVAELKYKYDKNGNRTQMQSFDDTTHQWDTVTDYEYDANNRMTGQKQTYNGDVINTTRYYYDNNGNMTAKQGTKKESASEKLSSKRQATHIMLIISERASGFNYEKTACVR